MHKKKSSHHPKKNTPHKKAKKPVKVFHTNKKMWLALSVLALTFGLAIGESHLENTSVAPEMALKINQDIQVSSFDVLTTSKRGVVRSNYRVSFLDSKSANPLEETDEPTKSGVKRVCFWEEEYETPEFMGEIVEVRLSEDIQPGEEFRVEVYMVNTGNTIWYSADSGCDEKHVVNMGTAKTQDRDSVLFNESSEEENTGWIGANRVKLVEDAVGIDETGTFAFTAVAPMEDNVYVEHWNLVAEEVEWFNSDDLEIRMEIPVGDVTEEDLFKASYMRDFSGNTNSITGEKNIAVDLTNQKLELRYDNTAVYSMTISSGASDTPTPTGDWTILNKQELRIGGASPHYRMPYWMGFTSWGHGFHSLPYLEKDGGIFWSEALSHIGIPVSHGCIRQLPDQSIEVYDFGEVGMPIHIYYGESDVVETEEV